VVRSGIRGVGRCQTTELGHERRPVALRYLGVASSANAWMMELAGRPDR
jgi:hypothetical protein